MSNAKNGENTVALSSQYDSTDISSLEMRLALARRQIESHGERKDLLAEAKELEAKLSYAKALLAHQMSALPRPLSPGDVIVLSASNLLLSHFLDGNTATGTVGLAPNHEWPFTGARWRVEDALVTNPWDPSEHLAFLHCMGTGGGLFDWLDGRTADGSVGMAPTTSSWYTGTYWRIRFTGQPESGTRPGTTIQLECQGLGPGNRRWLSITEDGKGVHLLQSPTRLSYWWWARIGDTPGWPA